MDLSKPVGAEAVVAAILFFVLLTAAGIYFVNRYRR